MVSIHEQQKKTLEIEIKRYQAEIIDIESRARRLEQERQSAVQETKVIKNKLDVTREESESKEYDISELHTTLKEAEVKTKAPKAQYERLCSENNELSKKLLDLREEGERLKDVKINAQRR